MTTTPTQTTTTPPTPTTPPPPRGALLVVFLTVFIDLLGFGIVLPVLPRQLPYRSGTIYFEIDTTSPLWKQLETSGAIALHLAGEFPGLELEMWALRE